MRLTEEKTDIIIDSTIDRIITHAGFLRLYSEKDDILGDIPVYQIRSIIILGTKLNIPASLIKLCATQKIPVHILTDRHKYHGSLNFTIDKGILNRQSQYSATLNSRWRLYLAKQIIYQKLLTQLRLCQYWRFDDSITAIQRIQNKIPQKTTTSQVIGIEGFAAVTYWDAFGKQLVLCQQIKTESNLMLTPPKLPEINLEIEDENGIINLKTADYSKAETFFWIGRQKFPTIDPVNSMLSLAYGLLATQCQTTLSLNGLDPYLGILHTTNETRPALTYDLMEIYRCLIVDMWILGLIQTKTFLPEDFTFTSGNVCTLVPHKKNEFFRLWFKRFKYHKFTTNHGQMSIHEFLELNTQLLIEWFFKLNENKERDRGSLNRLPKRLIVFESIEEFKTIWE